MFFGLCSSSKKTVQSSAMELGERVCDSEQLPEGGRLHLKIGQGVKPRYVSILRLQDKLYCIDAVCYHAGGPLGVGDIEDLNGKQCIVCPWHFYKIDLVTGEKYYQPMEMLDGRMIAGQWTSNGVKQRTHKITEHEGGIYVLLSKGGHIESDDYSCTAACGDRVMSQGAQSLQSVGGDGRLPSGLVMQKARERAAGGGGNASSRASPLGGAGGGSVSTIQE